MIAVITAFAGKRYCWETWIEGFEALDFDRSQLCVLWLDGSGDSEFGSLLASYVAEHGPGYGRFELRPGSASDATTGLRAAANCDWLRDVVLDSDRPFTWLLSYGDDVVPPPDGLQRLRSFLAAHPAAWVAAAAVPCYDRATGRTSLLAWHFGQEASETGLTPVPYQIPDVYQGTEKVDAVTLGFALLRPPALSRALAPPSALGLAFVAGLSSEQLLGWAVRQLGGGVFCLGEVRCLHYQLVGGRPVPSFPRRRLHRRPDCPPKADPSFERHIAILTCFSGKAEALDVFLHNLDSLDWETERLHLRWLDNSHSRAFGQRLEAALEARRHQFASACLLREDRIVGPKHAQVPFLYRSLRRSIPSGVPYVFCWEDDVLIPSRTLRVLHAELARGEDIGAVSGAVPYYRPGAPGTMEVLLWRYDSLEPEPAPDFDDLLRIGVGEAPYHCFGTSEIDGSGFGCLLTRRHLFDGASLLAERFGIYHDQIYGWELRLWGYRFMAVWHLACQHLQPNQEGHRRPVQLPVPQVDGLYRAMLPVPASVLRQGYPGLVVTESPDEGKYLLVVDEHSHPGEDYLAALVEALEADDNLSHAFGLALRDERAALVPDGSGPGGGPAHSLFRRSALNEIPDWEQLLHSQVETLTEELLANGWRYKQVPEVLLVPDPAPAAPPPRPPRYIAAHRRQEGCPLSVLFQNRPRTWSGGDLFHMDGLRQALRQEGFVADFRSPEFRPVQDWDVVHLMHIALPWSTEIAERCIESGHPYIVSSILNEVYSPSDLETVGLHASAIIAASEGEKQQLLSHCPGFADRIVVVPLGLDPSWFAAPAAPMELGERYVLCVGRYDPHKRQQVVLEACQQLGARVVFIGGPDCAGSWDYYDTLTARGYAKATLLKELPPGELQRFFYGAHVVCQASESESFGLTGIEAAAAGANLVMTTRTLAIDQFAWASFCDPDSVSSIARSIGEQLEAPRVPKPRPLSWREVARRTLPLYLAAVGRCDR